MAMKGYMEPMETDLVCEDPFDSIDDLLVFPNDDLEGIAMVDAWGNCSPIPLSPAPTMIAMECGSSIDANSVANGVDARATVSGHGISSEKDALGLYDEIDITNLEWLSNFFEDSELNMDFITTSSTPSTPEAKPMNKSPSHSRSLSPNSVLLPATSSSSSSSSSSSRSNSITDTSPPPPPATVPARARTKRPRIPSFSALQFTPPSPTSPPSTMKKPKKDMELASPSVRKCTHCDIQKTPQWRAGPMGPKTLCNACGVRYKSGRLFPEYRPAASPTFVPAVHSNSHKKVVEMRLTTAPVMNCDLVEFIRMRD